MSDIQEAIAHGRVIAKIIRSKPMESFAKLEDALGKIGALDAAARAAESHKAEAELKSIAADDKLSVAQNALTAAESAIQAVHMKAKKIIDVAEAQGSEILKRREEEGRKMVAAAARERDGIQKEILAAGKELDGHRKETAQALKIRKEAEEKLRQLREQAQSIGRG